MALTTAGAQFIAKAITGLNSPTLYNASNYYIGVGDSALPFNITDTDLQAGTNKLRKLVTSVTESGGVVTATTSFGTSEANFEWREWGSFNAPTGGTCYQRKSEPVSLGLKTSAQVWSMTLTLSHTAS
jgi:hypothetical protein